MMCVEPVCRGRRAPTQRYTKSITVFDYCNLFCLFALQTMESRRETPLECVYKGSCFVCFKVV